MICVAYNVIVVTAPIVACPVETRYAPHVSTARIGSRNAVSIPGNSTERSHSVRDSAANASRRSASTRSRRRAPSPSASTVRAPSTDSVIVPLSVAYAADSRRYAGAARRRYQRTTGSSTGSPASSPSATTGLVTRAATAVSAIVAPATSTRGTPNRTVYCTRSMSVVVRATRSPVPARSTTDSGSRVTVVTNSSRSSANTSSPRTIADRCAERISTVCTSTATTSAATVRST